MIKVLHYGLSENRGGIETYLYKITKHIDKKQFEFSFMDTNAGKAALRKELQQEGCKFYDITHRRVSLKRNRMEIQKLFENEKFDILHFHVNTLSYVTPIRIALKNGCKVIVHSRNAGASHEWHTLLLHKLNSLFLPRKKITMIAVSDKAGRWLFGKNANYLVYNNGIEIEKYRFDRIARNKYRHEWKFDDKKIIGVVGAFLPAKNHKFVLDIFEELKKVNPDVALVLVGDGVGRKAIENECVTRELSDVLFLGNRVDVNKMYSAFDILLMPSLFEGFPNVCLEAQTSGLPCLVSDVVTREVAVNDIQYFSLKKSAKEWALACDKTSVTDFKKRLKCADKVAQEGFSVDSEIQRLENLYKVLLEERV